MVMMRGRGVVVCCGRERVRVCHSCRGMRRRRVYPERDIEERTSEMKGLNSELTT
jgi:hypothetical protein